MSITNNGDLIVNSDDSTMKVVTLDVVRDADDLLG